MKLHISSNIESFLVVTDVEDSKFGKEKDLPHLRQGVHNIFRREDDSFLFLKHVVEDASLELNFVQPRSTEPFNGLSVSVDTYKESLKI